MDEIPLPLLAGAHSASALDAHGVGRAERDSPLWRQVHPRRWTWVPTDDRHPRQRALVGASVLPDDGALGGWAAAFLLGARDLDGSTPDSEQFQPVLLCLPRVRQRRW